jgi:hypothetical protein
MTESLLLPCDGCGQLADSVHISRRLQRLEWATRFRPLHIQALLIAGVAPEPDSEYFYAPEGSFAGEPDTILRWAGIVRAGKSVETVLTEFQKAGLMLVHVLECPVALGASHENTARLIEKALPSMVTRIRRSLKPKRVVILSAAPWADQLRSADLNCPVQQV